MAEHENFGFERRAGPEEPSNGAPDQLGKVDHRPRASTDSRALTSRLWFPVGTRAPADRKALSRTWLLNGKDLLPNLDGRSLPARRYRDIFRPRKLAGPAARASQTHSADWAAAWRMYLSWLLRGVAAEASCDPGPVGVALMSGNVLQLAANGFLFDLLSRSGAEL